MATFNQTVSADIEDGQSTYTVSGGGITWNSRLGYGSDPYFAIGRKAGEALWWGGARFTNVTIAQGATISSATLSIDNQVNNGGGLANIVCDAHDVDDCPQFSNGGVHGMGTWTATTYSDTQSSTGQSSGFGTLDFDVTKVVQELVDRTGWSSGNNMGFRFKVAAIGAASGYTYDLTHWADVDAVGTDPPTLNITYTEGGFPYHVILQATRAINTHLTR